MNESPDGATGTSDGFRVTDLSLRFGGVAALDGVSLAAMPGEVLAVIGPNGAGKTSLLNAVSGLVQPSSGSICLNGHELVGRRPAAIARFGVARTFQSPSLFGGLDLEANLLVGRHLHTRSGYLAGMVRFGRSAREERAQRAALATTIELLDLRAFCDVPVRSLPYGVQRRIELARAVVMEPSLLLLDEPSAGADLDERAAMVAAVLNVRDNLFPPPAIVLVEHDMGMVSALADRLLVLDFGVPIAYGLLDEVRRDERVVEAYLGARA